MSYPSTEKVTSAELQEISGAKEVVIVQRGDEERDGGGNIIVGTAIAEFDGKTKTMSTRHINPDDALRECARAIKQVAGVGKDGEVRLTKDGEAIKEANSPEDLAKTEAPVTNPPPQDGKKDEIPADEVIRDDPTDARVKSAVIDGPDSKGIGGNPRTGGK